MALRQANAPDLLHEFGRDNIALQLLKLDRPEDALHALAAPLSKLPQELQDEIHACTLLAAQQRLHWVCFKIAHAPQDQAVKDPPSELERLKFSSLIHY